MTESTESTANHRRLAAAVQMVGLGVMVWASFMIFSALGVLALGLLLVTIGVLIEKGPR